MPMFGGRPNTSGQMIPAMLPNGMPNFAQLGGFAPMPPMGVYGLSNMRVMPRNVFAQTKSETLPGPSQPDEGPNEARRTANINKILETKKYKMLGF